MCYMRYAFNQNIADADYYFHASLVRDRERVVLFGK